MKYRMRMRAVHLIALRNLLSDTTKEQACFLVVSHAQGDDETVLLVRDVLPLKKEDYAVHKFDQISVQPLAMVRAAKTARQLGCAICMVHTHPMSEGSVSFSTADDIGNEDSFAFFERMLPNQPNSCLVWNGSLQYAEGRVYTSSKDWSPISDITVVDDQKHVLITNGQTKEDSIDTQFDRQAQLLGKTGQRSLSKRRIAIIGNGGIGSAAGVVLVHTGIKDFDLVDFDFIEKSNLPRIIGATPLDVDQKSLKVDVLARYIKSLTPEALVRTHNLQVEAKELLSVLISADLVICATDDTTSRAYLNQLCHQYFVPILDLGVQFAVNPGTGILLKEVGRVHLMLPGTACMSCTGNIHPQTLAQESLSDEMRENRIKEGYFQGADVSEPSTMIFNMQVAGLGAQRIVEWITGVVAFDKEKYDQFRFFGLNGEKGIRPVRKRANKECLFCSNESVLLGCGDIEKMLVLPRKIII